MRRFYLYRAGPIILVLAAFICRDVYALQGSTGDNGSNTYAVHSLGITGKGVNIGFIAAGNILTTHQAFEDSNGICHVVNHDVSGAGFTYNFHDTPMAGIIISRGTLSHPDDIGVAPDAFVHCVRITSLLDKTGYQNAFNELIINQSCRVIVTGIQVPYDPNYHLPDGDSDNTKLYDYYADKYDVVFANAAGNSYSNITIFGDAYNGITTGALEDPVPDDYFRAGNVSNHGPTVDGRRKPDVMAPSTYQVVPGYSSSSNNYWYTTPGDGATSWSVPHTAGLAALLFEYADQTTDPDDGHNEVIKAVIINSTFPNIDDEAGSHTYPANPENTWHSERGYGRVDGLRAVYTLSVGRIVRDTTVAARAGWAYDIMDPGTMHNYFITGKRNERLVLTVVWNRLITKQGSVYSATLPKFNIDVTVTNPSGDTVFYEDDDVNNVEKIDLLLPVDGNYTVFLANAGLQTSDYALAFEKLPPLSGDFNIDYAVDGYDLELMVSDWLTGESDTDIIPDGRINGLDFTRFAEDWLKIDPRYYN